MKRVTEHVIDSDSDGSDIWEYKSLKREKKNTENEKGVCRPLSQSQTEKGNKSTQPSLQKKKSKKRVQSKRRNEKREKSVTPKPDTPKENVKESSLTGHCPSCQVPFSVLSMKSPTWHVHECLDVVIPDTACPDGVLCTNTLPDHFWRYNHRSLALARGTGQTPSGSNVSAKVKLNFRRDQIPPCDTTRNQTPPRATTRNQTRPCAVNREKTRSCATSRNQICRADNNIELITDSESSDEEQLSSLKAQNSNDMCNLNISNNLRTDCRNIPNSGTATTEQRNICVSDVEGTDNCEKDLEQMIEDAFNVYSKDDSRSSGDEQDEKSISDVDELESDYETNDVSTIPVIIIPDEDTHNLEASSKLTPQKDHRKILCQSKPSPTLSEKSIVLSQGSLDGYFKCVSPISPLTPLTPKQQSNEETLNKSKMLSSNKKTASAKSSSKKNYTSQPPGKGVTAKSPGISPLKRKTSANSGKKKNVKKTDEGRSFQTKSNASSQQLPVPSSSSLSLCVSEADDTILSHRESSSSKEEVEKDIGRDVQVDKSQQYSNDGMAKTGPKINAFTLLMSKKQSNTSKKSSAVVKGNNAPSAQNAMNVLMNARNPKVEDQGRSKTTAGQSQGHSKTTAAVTSEQLPRVPTPDQVTESYTGGYYGNRAKRPCPFYKKMPDTAITVDAFSYGVIPGCSAYFLSHFHYDHYSGLTKKFQQPIYCSKITANLVQLRLGVEQKYVHVLPIDQATVVEGVEVTLMEANQNDGLQKLPMDKSAEIGLLQHFIPRQSCPGAVLFLFKLRNGKVYLHTGDFRANQAMESYPALTSVHVHQLYLDTTYCDPSHAFPPQKDVIEFVVSLVQKKLQTNPNTLIVCGSYTIGKERIFMGIAEALQCKICVQRDKKNVLDCLEDDRLRKLVSLNMADSNLHVLPMAKLNLQSLCEHMSCNKRYTEVLAFEPTGWTHTNKIISLDQIRPKINRDGIQIYGVPYSEHSSYLEMKRFVQFIKADKILPTVNNGNARARQKMERLFKSWMDELKVVKTTPKKQTSMNSWVT